MRAAVNPTAVPQHAEAYQRLLDIAAQADAVEGIRQGLDDLAHGRTRPAREVFDEIRRKHGIPRSLRQEASCLSGHLRILMKAGLRNRAGRSIAL